jgi:hypothetical protein
MLNENMCTDENAKKAYLLMQYVLLANVSVLVTLCHTSVLLWEASEESLSGLDQLLIIASIMRYSCSIVSSILELMGRVTGKQLHFTTQCHCHT